MTSKHLTPLEFKEIADPVKHCSIINVLKGYKKVSDFNRHYSIVQTEEYITLVVKGYDNGEGKLFIPLDMDRKKEFVADKILEDSYIGADPNNLNIPSLMV